MKTVAVDDNVRINLIILVLAALSIIASFNPHWHLWGLDSVGVFFLPFRLLCLGLLILLAIPAISAKIGSKLNNYLYSYTEKQLKILYAVLAAALVFLFILFKSNNHLLGDGYNLLGVIKRGNYFSPTEPLDYLLHNLVFNLIGYGDSAAYLSYAICSIACGAIFLTALYYIIKNKVDLILSLAVVFCFTALQFFFGYIENYTFSFLFMLFYSFSAIRDLSNHRLSLLTIALLILACAFQLSSISLIPSFIFLLLMNISGKKKYLIMLGVILACGLLVAGYMILFSQVPLAGIFVPMVKTNSNPYTLFSGQHIRDIINIVLLNYPLLLIVIFISTFRRKILSPFYLLLIGPGLIYMLVVDPKLGVYRDWDMLSLCSGPLLAFFIASFFLEKEKKAGWAASVFLTLGIFGILHTGAWVGQNSSKEISYPAVKEAVNSDIHYTREYLAGYRCKSWAALISKFEGDNEEIARSALERYYGDPNDTLSTIQMIESLMWAGDTTMAAQMVLANRYRFPGYDNAAVSFSNVLIHARMYMDAERICRDFLSTGMQSPQILLNIGLIKEIQRQYDSSVYYYDLAYKVWPDAPVDMQLDLYMKCIISGYDSLACSGLERILPRLDSANRKFSVDVMNVLRNGNSASIDSLRKALLISAQSAGAR